MKKIKLKIMSSVILSGILGATQVMSVTLANNYNYINGYESITASFESFENAGTLKLTAHKDIKNVVVRASYNKQKLVFKKRA